MASKVAICNLALTDLGANIIANLETDSSKEAKNCRVYYDILVDRVLEAHHWDFAKTWVVLALDAGYVFVDDQYEYAYQKPADFIRFSRMENKASIFEVRGETIVSNLEDAEIEYIKRVSDSTLYPPHFVSALHSLLRAHLAIPLARKSSKGISWMRSYTEIDLPAAKLLDAQQGNPPIVSSTRHTDATDTWLSSRPS